MYFILYLILSSFYVSAGQAMPLSSDGFDMAFDAQSMSLDRNQQIETLDGDVVAISSSVMIAADKLEINRLTRKLKANGKVVFIAADEIFTADSLDLDLDQETFVLTNAMVSIGDPVSRAEVLRKILGFNPSEEEFRAALSRRFNELGVKKSSLVREYRDLSLKDDALEAPLSSSAVLFSPRPSQCTLAELSPEQRLFGKDSKEEVIFRYMNILEQEESMRRQPTQFLAGLPASVRESYERRREFWEKSRNGVLQQVPPQPTMFFVMTGDKISKVDSINLEFERAFFTPCHCAADEIPAWGFRAETIKAQEGGYASLRYAILEIKGVPVIYFPMLKLPLKSIRQPGFLMPSLTYTPDNGNIFSQSIYFTPSESHDITTSFDVMEKRGIRYGFEQRIKTDEYSGWQVSGEALRDQTWISQRYFREKLSNAYVQGLNEVRAHPERAPASGAALPGDSNTQVPEYQTLAFWQGNFPQCLAEDTYEDCVRRQIRGQLLSPENDWRGKMQWEGLSILQPRVIFISQGTLMSDHRYPEDLYIPNMNDIGVLGINANLYTGANARIHGDWSDFYVGAGSSVSDQFLGLNTFEGFQLPAYYKIQSRLFELTPENSPIRFYGGNSWEQKMIRRLRPAFSQRPLDDRVGYVDLSDANWSRYYAGIVSPLSAQSVIQSDFFADWQMRFIDTDPVAITAEPTYHFEPQEAWKQRHSTIESGRYGLHFSLPIDGVMPLSYAKNSDDPWPQDEYKAYLEHWMTFDLTVSMRPYVKRVGPYGSMSPQFVYSDQSGTWKPTNPGFFLTYFDSDRPSPNPSESVQPEIMDRHQIVAFSMGHDWFYSERTWQKKLRAAEIDPDADPDDESIAVENTEPQPVTPYEKARAALEETLNMPLVGDDEDRPLWFASNYQLVERGRTAPVHFDTGIGYDFIKAEARVKDLRAQSALPPNQKGTIYPAEPWSSIVSNLRVTAEGTTLGVNSSYHLYSDMFTRLNFSLTPPLILGLGINLNYLIEQAISRDPVTYNYVSNITRTETVNLSRAITSAISATGMYGQRFNAQTPNAQPMQQMAGVTLAYMPPSLCWGLKGGWQRAFTDLNWSGQYLVSLVVTFYNQQREFGNFAARFNQPQPPG